LQRFGRPSGVVGFGAAGLLGVLLASWPFIGALELLNLWHPPGWLRFIYPMSFMGLGIVVLFLTLRVLLNWAVEGSDLTEPPEWTEE
jgi:hypothetical protein